MGEQIGIDAGGSLIKLAYRENGKVHFKKYPLEEMDHALMWVKTVMGDRKVVLTGGKAAWIKTRFFHNAVMIDEFTAACDGVNYLTERENLDTGTRFLLVNIGTGTSWFFVDGEKYKRILGSGIGGGMYMGLGRLLTGSNRFSELVELSSYGRRENVDLLVKDIYEPDEPPIPGNLTAGNFAKSKAVTDLSSEDKMASVMNMLSETITLLTLQAASMQKTNKVVYIGSTLAGNSPLRNTLASFASMMELDTFFLQDGEFSGAIGAMLS